MNDGDPAESSTPPTTPTHIDPHLTPTAPRAPSPPLCLPAPVEARHVDVESKSVKAMSHEEFFATHPRGTGGYRLKLVAKPRKEAEQSQTSPDDSSPSQRMDIDDLQHAPTQSSPPEATDKTAKDYFRMLSFDIERQFIQKMKVAREAQQSTTPSNNRSNESTGLDQATEYTEKQKQQLAHIAERVRNVHHLLDERIRTSKEGLAPLADLISHWSHASQTLLRLHHDGPSFSFPSDERVMEYVYSVKQEMEDFVEANPHCRLPPQELRDFMGHYKLVDIKISAHVPFDTVRKGDPQYPPDYIPYEALEGGILLVKEPGPGDTNSRAPLYRVFRSGHELRDRT